MYSRIVVIICLLVLTSCSSTKWMQGSWEGQGDQVDGQKWNVDLTIDNKNEVTIKYPSLSCSGTWVLVKSEKNESIFTEKIEEGITNCDQGVEVHVIKGDENSIKIEYFIRSFNATEPIAIAYMSRK